MFLGSSTLVLNTILAQLTCNSANNNIGRSGLYIAPAPKRRVNVVSRPTNCTPQIATACKGSG